jgi:hypothetical protein
MTFKPKYRGNSFFFKQTPKACQWSNVPMI